MLIELTSAGATLYEMRKIAHLLLTFPPNISVIETLSEDAITLEFVKTRWLDQKTNLQ